MPSKTILAEATRESFEPTFYKKTNEVDNKKIFTENKYNIKDENSYSAINENNKIYNNNKTTKTNGLPQLGKEFDLQLRKKLGKILQMDETEYRKTNGAANENGECHDSAMCGKALDVDSTSKEKKAFYEFEMPLIWYNIISIGIFHFLTLYTFLIYPYSQKWKSIIWGFFLGGLSGFGVTAGVHRLWCHRSYKAKTPLRIILMLCYALAGQNTIFDWVRDHRVHHKYSETDADPHNAKRGFFFAHVGWLMMKKNPEVIRKGQLVDMSDVLADPVVQFHQRYFTRIKILVCFILPTIVPVIFWNESWYYSLLTQAVVRYVLGLNFTWFVNSAAHLWGNKPYDKRISPSENRFVSLLSIGEGWHNYHHVFPWDYKAAELGDYGLNLTTFWLDVFAKIGWAYDMKYPSKELVRRVAEKNGDGSHPLWGNHGEEVDESCDKWKSFPADNDVSR